jgi:hypothetical protein
MDPRNYQSMSQMPAHGNASMSKVGNAREGFRPGSMPSREGFDGMNGMRGMAGDMVPGAGMARDAAQKAYEVACHFPAPPPKRCYCHPAAFTSLDGRSHARILDAYGHSRPCSSGY